MSAKDLEFYLVSIVSGYLALRMFVYRPAFVDSQPASGWRPWSSVLCLTWLVVAALTFAAIVFSGVISLVLFSGEFPDKVLAPMLLSRACTEMQQCSPADNIVRWVLMIVFIVAVYAGGLRLALRSLFAKQPQAFSMETSRSLCAVLALAGGTYFWTLAFPNAISLPWLYGLAAFALLGGLSMQLLTGAPARSR